MAATVTIWEDGWPIMKPWIPHALEQILNKQCRIKFTNTDLDEKLCFPVRIVFETKYDTRLYCIIGNKMMMIYRNNLEVSPFETPKMPLCATVSQEKKYLTNGLIKKYLEQALSIVDQKKRPDIAARKKKIKRMLQGDNWNKLSTFNQFKCNEKLPLNPKHFSRWSIITYPTQIALKSPCVGDNYVRFSEFGDGVCENETCFYCSFSEFVWSRGVKARILDKFINYLENGECNACYYNQKIISKNEEYGNVVKFATSCFNNPFRYKMYSAFDDLSSEEEEEFSWSSEDSLINWNSKQPPLFGDFDGDENGQLSNVKYKVKLNPRKPLIKIK